jgi:hypothetical protein
LCKRLVEKKWKIVYLPIGGVVQNGISDWKNRTRVTQALAPYMESLYKFIKKHNGKQYVRLAWCAGAVSALISVPFLFFISLSKRILNKKSESIHLFPLWVKITIWHFTKGIKLVI